MRACAWKSPGIISRLHSPYTGYINYFVREGERVSTRDTVYSVDESGKLASLLNAGDMGETSWTYSASSSSAARSSSIGITKDQFSSVTILPTTAFFSIRYAELIFNNSCISFCTDRYIDIELVVNDQQGLKIPNSAIAEKEFFIIPADFMTKGGPNGNYGVLKVKMMYDYLSP